MGGEAAKGFYVRYGKRALDVVLTLLALLVFGPLILVTALAVWWKLGRPVLFRQQRVGHREQVFRVFKFRTMTDARNAEGNLLPDDQRLPPFGKQLRRFSLDELPQFFNVLRGELSLVGPRPLLIRYLPRYDDRQRRRHDVLPGITGWAQVNGRNAIDWPARLEMDVWYTENVSLALDLRILLMTVQRVVSGRGAKPGGGAEFEEFWGTETPPDGVRLARPVEESELKTVR